MTFTVTPEHRLDLEFRAFQESLGDTSEHVLMPPSELDADSEFLTFGEALASGTTTLIFRYTGGRADESRPLPTNPQFPLNLGTTGLNVPDRDKLVVVEVADNAKYLQVGIIRRVLAVIPASIVSAVTYDASTFTQPPTAATIISAVVPTGELLRAGSTFRITVRGTVKVAPTSGTLTFKPFVGPTAAAQTFVMPTQTTAATVPFYLEVNATVQTANTAGSKGKYVSNGYGRIEFSTAEVLTATLTTTGITTAEVDTDADSPVVKLTATWEKNLANILDVQTATIEQVA